MSISQVSKITSLSSKIIAVTGATGTVGQHVTEELLRGGFQVVVLLRRENPEFVARLSVLGKLTAEVVDLDSAEKVGAVLRMYSVDTVVSTYFLLPDNWHTEVALVEAAEMAAVRRFAPTCFAMPVNQIGDIEYYSPKLRTEERLLKTKMEFTNFACGVFMNYLASGFLPNEEGVPLGYLRPLKMILDVENGTGTIPGTGDKLVPFTEIRDVARGVAQACAFDGPWVRETGYMVGDYISYNDVVRIIEEETGRKLAITYLPRSQINEHIANAENIVDRFYSQVSLAIIDGKLDYPNTLATIAAGEPPRSWKAVSVREFVKK